ncbi:hypothetical protein [Wukongibacter sp. M2B1]
MGTDTVIYTGKKTPEEIQNEINKLLNNYLDNFRFKESDSENEDIAS